MRDAVTEVNLLTDVAARHAVKCICLFDFADADKITVKVMQYIVSKTNTFEIHD
jgi:hypothetical protein